MTQELDTFLYTEHKTQDMENVIDPENNLFSNINISCRYYTENQYNATIREKKRYPLFTSTPECMPISIK